VTAALDTYAELRLAEGKLLRWGERGAKAACALQPRDLEILVALARYRFLTTGQIAELWWEGRGLRAVRRRMTRLFEAGFVERFRPQTLRGSYQWTYCLARDGFRAAQQTGELAPNLKFAPRRESIFDYRYVIHDLRVNEWVLRYRELLADRLLDWAGPDESLVQPPKGRAVASLGDGEHDVIGIDDDAMRPIQPDARLDIVGVHGEVPLFVEYDRTRRVDKNYDKFRRYEAFLAGWWPTVTPLRSRRPAVVFICQDDDHRRRFVDAADWQLTAYQQRWADLNPSREYVARDRVLFAIEEHIRTGRPGAVRLPHHPPSSPNRDGRLRGVWLPGVRDD
jgi:Replication-relaxation